VWVHGSGEQARLTWRAPVVKATIGSGMAFLSYDKRGVGESEGVCCPGDEGHHYNLLAADADGAVAALRSRPEIDTNEIGFLGASEAGWVVPLAVSRSNGSVAFTALVDGPAVTTDEEEQWSDLAGEESDNPPALTPEKKAELEEKLDPGGFDPVPLIQRMTIPGIWLYGRQDRSIPSDKSAATIRRLAKANGRDFTVVVFPKAGHGLLDVPPTDPRALPTLLAWIRTHVRPR
jgi:uncharacterized protein